MHEVSIMEEAVRVAVETARLEGDRRVTGMRLRVGVLSGAVPDALRFAFEVARSGTVAEGAELEIEEVGAAGWCPACEKEFECADYLSACPGCGCGATLLRRGRELQVVSVDLD